MKKTYRKLTFLACLTFAAAAMTSCIDDGDETIALENGEKKPGGNGNGTNIPDDPAESTPVLPGGPYTPIPNPTEETEYTDGGKILTLTMPGIQDKQGNWITFYGTGNKNQNIWVEVDGKPKGILVIDVKGETKSVKSDIVFTVDNSSSMDEEADAIASQIMSWSQTLASSNLDVQFGVVGYAIDGKINGALDMASADKLSNYLDRSKGTNRTVGFDSNASIIKSYHSNYDSGLKDECGAAAIRFANDHFNFRQSSSRTYVNFTDEPNQPNGDSNYSVEWFNRSNSNWGTGAGTIHTVYSGYVNYPWRALWEEDPRLMSTYTGGTTKNVNPNASDLNLNDLPVTGALTHTFIIRLFIPKALCDGSQHTIRIVIKTSNGVIGEWTGYINFGTYNKK